jgi:hypothetical protein
MNTESQNNKSQEHFFEQYKLYIEMMDRVTARRGQTNQFYLSLISASLGLLVLFSDPQKVIAYPTILFFLLSLLGLLLCASWWFNINSYKQLNYLKFKVIFEMEKQLPFACYTREWEIEKEVSDRYRRLTKLEKYIPICFGFLYLLLIVYAILKLK